MFSRVACVVCFLCLVAVRCDDLSSMLQKLKALDKEDTSNFTSSNTAGTQTNETEVKSLLDNLKALDTHHSETEPTTINKTEIAVDEKAPEPTANKTKVAESEKKTSNDSSSEKENDSVEKDSKEKDKRDLDLSWMDQYRKKNRPQNQKSNRVDGLLLKARNQNQKAGSEEKNVTSSMKTIGNLRKRSVPNDGSGFREFMERGHEQWRQREGVRPLSWDSVYEVRAKHSTDECKTNKGGATRRLYVGSVGVKSRKTISRQALDAWMAADSSCDKCIRMSSTTLTKFGCAINMKCGAGPLVVCRYGK